MKRIKLQAYIGRQCWRIMRLQVKTERNVTHLTRLRFEPCSRHRFLLSGHRLKSWLETRPDWKAEWCFVVCSRLSGNNLWEVNTLHSKLVYASSLSNNSNPDFFLCFSFLSLDLRNCSWRLIAHNIVSRWNECQIEKIKPTAVVLKKKCTVNAISHCIYLRIIVMR